jgi:C1A family cysteine protease
MVDILQAGLGPVGSQLRQLGFESVEAVLGAAAVAGRELEQVLGMPLAQALAPAVGLTRAIPPALQDELAELPCALGVRLDAQPSFRQISAAVAVAPPPSTAMLDFSGQMPPIRDQGQRGTCVAFASLAAYEFYLTQHGAYRDMSEQFLYCDCKANDGSPTIEGTWIHIAFAMLQRDGCCEEGDWPYNPKPIAGNEGQGPFPPMTQVKALSFRTPGSTALPATSVQDIKNSLGSNRVVAFSVPVYNSWYYSTQVRLTGDINNPIPGEVSIGGHAMCIIGYVDMPNREDIGGGRFILRNSWGTAWGQQCAYGAGNGTIPYLYLSRFGMEAYAVV